MVFVGVDSETTSVGPACLYQYLTVDLSSSAQTRVVSCNLHEEFYCRAVLSQQIAMFFSGKMKTTAQINEKMDQRFHFISKNLQNLQGENVRAG